MNAWGAKGYDTQRNGSPAEQSHENHPYESRTHVGGRIAVRRDGGQAQMLAV
jgi:hypothetical protein